MKFKIGDIANGIETSEEIVEFNNYVEVLESLVESANLYCESADKESKIQIDMIKALLQKGGI